MKPPAPPAFPSAVTICGKRYSVTYTQELGETDVDKRYGLWGQMDAHTRSIRVYVGKADRQRQPADVLETLLHEMIHAILTDSKLLTACLKDGMEENFVDTLGVQLADTLTRNNLVRMAP